MDTHLPAEQLAQEIRTVVAQGGITVEDLATSMGVHPQWLLRLMTGEVTELTLLTVVGICRRLRLMPEDIWEPGLVAQVFRAFPSNTFDPEGDE